MCLWSPLGTLGWGGLGKLDTVCELLTYLVAKAVLVDATTLSRDWVLHVLTDLYIFLTEL
jgi:hypothetical protein